MASDRYHATRSILSAIEANDVDVRNKKVSSPSWGSRGTRTKCRCPDHQSLHCVVNEKVTNPSNTLVDVGGSVRETLDLSRLSSEKTVEVGSDLVGLTGT
jgi:hypothetical protein